MKNLLKLFMVAGISFSFATSQARASEDGLQNADQTDQVEQSKDQVGERFGGGESQNTIVKTIGNTKKMNKKRKRRSLVRSSDDTNPLLASLAIQKAQLKMQSAQLVQKETQIKKLKKANPESPLVANLEASAARLTSLKKKSKREIDSLKAELSENPETKFIVENSDKASPFAEKESDNEKALTEDGEERSEEVAREEEREGEEAKEEDGERELASVEEREREEEREGNREEQERENKEQESERREEGKTTESVT